VDDDVVVPIDDSCISSESDCHMSMVDGGRGCWRSSRAADDSLDQCALRALSALLSLSLDSHGKVSLRSFTISWTIPYGIRSESDLRVSSSICWHRPMSTPFFASAVVEQSFLCTDFCFDVVRAILLLFNN